MKQVFCFIITISITSCSFGQIIKEMNMIENVETGKVINPVNSNVNDGIPIVTSTGKNNKAAIWKFKKTGENTYHLINNYTGKSMQAESSENGAKIMQEPINAGSNLQKWVFISHVNGIYRIKLSGKDLYLTPDNTASGANTKLVLKPRAYGKSQLWILESSE